MGIDIVLSVVGVILTLFFASNQLFGFFKRISTKSIFNQKWRSFHFSTDSNENDLLKCGTWDFSRSIFNKISVTVSYADSSRIYKGEMVGVDQHINVILSRDGVQKQYIMCRFLNSDEPIIDAVWFGSDDVDILTSDFWFLTVDEKITEQDAKKYINEKRRSLVGRHKFKSV